MTLKNMCNNDFKMYGKNEEPLKRGIYIDDFEGYAVYWDCGRIKYLAIGTVFEDGLELETILEEEKL